jgi:hypothetical protein
MFDVIREIYDKFDTPYVGIYILNQPTLMVRSPELLKKILVKDFDKFVDRKVALNESVDPIAANASSMRRTRCGEVSAPKSLQFSRREK